MSTAQHETHQTVAQTMLQGIVEAICDRAGDTIVQRNARARDVAESVQAFQPRDPVEIMLAGMAVTHVHLVQDSARDVLRGQDDLLKARTKSTIIALGRGMIGFLKELRTAQARTIEGWADAGHLRTVATETPAPLPTPAPLRTEAARPNAPPVPQTTPRSPARVTEPQPPTPLLPPLRRADTSIAAMMAVLSPPTTPCVMSSTAAKPSAAICPASHTRPVAPQTEAGKEPARPLNAQETLASEAESAPKHRGAIGYAAPVTAADGSVRPVAG